MTTIDGKTRLGPVRPPFLGDLELAVMEHLWSRRSADVKAVYRAIGHPRSITLNTIQSTLKRLLHKGLLVRTKVSHAHVYSARYSRDVFYRDVLHGVVEQLMAGRADAAVAAFVDFAEAAGVEQLTRLERLVNERLDAQEGKRR